jgi:hypothetical protein
MAQLMRFGRRVPPPSTVQIIHELLVMEQNDNARGAIPAKDAGTADRISASPPKNRRSALGLTASRSQIQSPPRSTTNRGNQNGIPSAS